MPYDDFRRRCRSAVFRDKRETSSLRASAVRTKSSSSLPRSTTVAMPRIKISVRRRRQD